MTPSKVISIVLSFALWAIFGNIIGNVATSMITSEEDVEVVLGFLVLALFAGATVGWGLIIVKHFQRKLRDE